MRRFAADCLTLSLLALLLGAALESCALRSAPMPFPRQTRAPTLTRTRLVGTWNVRWGTVSCQMTFRNSGTYTCFWPGAHYVGSWGVRNGSLWLTESSRPQDASSWQSYAVRLRPATMCGPVEVGATGVVVTLQRRKP